LPYRRAVSIHRAIALSLVCASLGCDALLGADFDDLQHPGTGSSASGGSSASSSAGGNGGGQGGHAGQGEGGLGPALPLVCGDMAGLQAGAPWPMEGYCPTRQGRSPALAFDKPKVRWVAQLPSQIGSEPIVDANGTVYVVTQAIAATSRLHAVKNGTPSWFRDVNSIASPAIGADGTVYVADTTTLFALDDNGNEKWAHPVGGVVRGSPAIGADGTVYVAASSGVRAVTPSGSEAWTATQVGQASTAVAIGLDGSLYVGNQANTFYALDGQGGTKWTFPTTAYIRDLPIVGGSDLIYLTNDQHVYAVNAAGEQKWSFSKGQYPTITPSPFGDTLFTVAIESDNSFTLWSLDAQGQPNWSVTQIGTVGRFALSGDGLLVSFSSYRPMVFSPEIAARRPDGGEVAWNLESMAPAVYAWPGAAFGADGVIYAGVVDKLYAIEAE
jgi:hypothetical protein